MSRAIMVREPSCVCERIKKGNQSALPFIIKPNLKPPFKCYIYCEKMKDTENQTDKFDVPLSKKWRYGNNMVVGEFVCDKIESAMVETILKYGFGPVRCDVEGSKWHISEVKFYDEPKEVREFRKPCPTTNRIKVACRACPYGYIGDSHWLPTCHAYLTCPPQSWKYVEEL